MFTSKGSCSLLLSSRFNGLFLAIQKHLFSIIKNNNMSFQITYFLFSVIIICFGDV